MASFIGMTVQVTLKNPPNTVLVGRVVDIVPGQMMALQDIVFPSTGARWAQYTVQGDAIADVKVIEKSNESVQGTQMDGQAQQANGQTPHAPPPQQMPPMPAQQIPPQQVQPPTPQQMPPFQQTPMQRPPQGPMHPGQMNMQRPHSNGPAPPGIPMPMQMQQRQPPQSIVPPQFNPMQMQGRPSGPNSPASFPQMQRPSSAAMHQPPPAPTQRPPSASFAPTPPMPVPVAATAPLARQIQLPFATAQSGAAPKPPTQRAEFKDPAIMSIGRSPAPKKTATPTAASESPATPVKTAMSRAAETLPQKPSSPFIGDLAKMDPTKTDPVKTDLGAKLAAAKQSEATLPQPTSSYTAIPANKELGTRLAAAKEAAPAVEEDAGQGDTSGKTKRGRRGIRNKNKVATQEAPAVMNIEVSRNGNDMNGTVKRGKGWRQTPLLQPSPQPGASPAKKSKLTRRQRDEQKEGQNGWATEEATDIQELGDFDFEKSNDLFDKKTVFDELRQGDTTADEDRLVGFNRLARPGTYGGKNLHPTENVLSPKLPAAEEDSSDADTEMRFRSTSRASASKRRPSRQNSAVVDNSRHPLAASMSSDRGLSRSAISLANRNGKPVATKAERVQSPHSVVSSKPVASPRPSALSHEAYLAMQHSGVQCPVLLPGALETLEAETTTRYGLTQDAITETAARSIAELAMSMAIPIESTSRRGSRTQATRNQLNPNSTPPVIVVLAGNHIAGARAVAAARHLSPRHSKIILAEAQYESAATQEDQMVKQTAMLKRMARHGAEIKRGTWRKASNYIKNLSGPPAIIIDALLAGATYDSLLSPNADHSEAAQRETREMIDWANRSRAPVLSIACPSGVSGFDGSTTLLDGEPLAVRPDRVLALGAPMQGVLDAMKGGESWEVDLADVGINIGLQLEDQVAFNNLWVDELRFVEA